MGRGTNIFLGIKAGTTTKKTAFSECSSKTLKERVQIFSKEYITWQEYTENNTIPSTFNDDRAGGIVHFILKPTDALKMNTK